jgi:hypothetical protein
LKVTKLPFSICGCTNDPPRWLWLWLPLLLFTVLLLLAVRVDSDPDYSRRPWAHYMVPYSEHDVIEQGTYQLSIWYRLARHPEAINPLPRPSP